MESKFPPAVVNLMIRPIIGDNHSVEAYAEQALNSENIMSYGLKFLMESANEFQLDSQVIHAVIRSVVHLGYTQELVVASETEGEQPTTPTPATPDRLASRNDKN